MLLWKSVWHFSFLRNLLKSTFLKHVLGRLCSTENRTTVSKMRVISEHVHVINDPSAEIRPIYRTRPAVLAEHSSVGRTIVRQKYCSARQKQGSVDHYKKV